MINLSVCLCVYACSTVGIGPHLPHYLRQDFLLTAVDNPSLCLLLLVLCRPGCPQLIV